MFSLRGYIHNVFCILLLTVCPLLFPKIGEQQYSYVQGLCFLGLAWMALTYHMQKRRQAMVVRGMDIAIAVCLLALLLHIFWIRPVSLSIWRWVDAAGLFAFYVFVRQSPSKGIRILLACVMVGGLLQCLYAGMQGMGWLPSLHNAFPMTGSFLNPAPLAGYLAVLACMGMVGLFCSDGFQGKLRTVAWVALLLFIVFVLLLNSRAAWFALLVVGVGILYGRMKMKRKRVYAVGIVIALGVSLYVLPSPFMACLSVSDTGRVKEAIEVLKPYQKVSPKGKTLEQKAVLLEMRELYQSIHKNTVSASF